MLTILKELAIEVAVLMIRLFSAKAEEMIINKKTNEVHEERKADDSEPGDGGNSDGSGVQK